MEKYYVGATINVEITVEGIDITQTEGTIRVQNPRRVISDVETVLDGAVAKGTFVPVMAGTHKFYWYGVFQNGAVVKSTPLVERVLNEGELQ